MLRIEVMGDRAEIAEPGQLATAITALAVPDTNIEAVRQPSEADILVYSRRVDDTLDEANAFCKENGVPLIVTSTGIDTAIPSNPNYPLVIAPNTGLRVLRFLQRVEEQAAHLDGWNTQIVEHHQPSKKDTSGTAKKLAEMLGLSKDDVVSVRNFEQAKSDYPSITDDNATSYAGHRVTFTNPKNGDEEESNILVLGREEYANGLIVICDALRRPEVKSYLAEHGNRVHVVELLTEGFLD